MRFPAVVLSALMALVGLNSVISFVASPRRHVVAQRTSQHYAQPSLGMVASTEIVNGEVVNDVQKPRKTRKVSTKWYSHVGSLSKSIFAHI
jgi:hypothetical protein